MSEPTNTEPLTLTLKGQIRGGKNNMGVSQSGHHYPKGDWSAWRDEAVFQISQQLPRNWKPLELPTDIHLAYYAGDHRRRDNPAIVDAIWHVLEKAGVVADDTLLWPVKSNRDYDKDNPRAIITIFQ